MPNIIQVEIERISEISYAPSSKLYYLPPQSSELICESLYKLRERSKRIIHWG